MTTDLVPFNDKLNYADAMVKSERFPSETNKYKALVKIEAGLELGLKPVQALMNIHMVQGRITLGSGVIAAQIKASGKYNYRVLKQTNEECQIEFFEKWDKNPTGSDWTSVGSVSFTVEDAKQAGLLGKDVWKKYPSDMLFARCITRGARRFTPDVFGGPIYEPTELEEPANLSPNEVEGSFTVLEDGPATFEEFAKMVYVKYGVERDDVLEMFRENHVTAYYSKEWRQYVDWLGF